MHVGVQQPPAVRVSLRKATRHLKVPLSNQAKELLSRPIDNHPAGSRRQGLRPLSDESVTVWTWVDKLGSALPDEPKLQAAATHLWGCNEGDQQVLESAIQSLESPTCREVAVDAWLSWWASHHPSVPVGMLVAPHRTLPPSLRRGRFVDAHVQAHRQTYMPPSLIQHLWFPLCAPNKAWALIYVDILGRHVRTFGECTDCAGELAVMWADVWAVPSAPIHPWNRETTAFNDVQWGGSFLTSAANLLC